MAKKKRKDLKNILCGFNVTKEEKQEIETCYYESDFPYIGDLYRDAVLFYVRNKKEVDLLKQKLLISKVATS